MGRLQIPAITGKPIVGVEEVRQAQHTSRGVRRMPRRMLAVFFALAFIVTIPGPPALGQVGFKSTTILQSQTTVTGQRIEFPMFRYQITAIMLERAPGGQTVVHMHPFTLAG